MENAEWKAVMKKKGIRSLQKKLRNAIAFLYTNTVIDFTDSLQVLNEYQESYSLATQILYMYPEFAKISKDAYFFARQCSLIIPETNIKDRYVLI